MQFLLANGRRFFVPAIFPTKETLRIYPIIYLMYALEMIFIIIMCLGSLLLVNALGRSERLFHRNVIQIAQVHFILFTLSQASRLLIFFYEIGIIEKSGTFDHILFVLFFIRFMPLFCMMTMISAMTTERLLASRYIYNYERVPRRWISVLVNGGSLVFGALYYVILQSFFFGLSLMLFFVVATTVISICSSLAIQYVNRRDAARLRDLSKESGYSKIYYTLSMKFQLTENVRVTKWLARMSTGISIWGLFGMFMSAPCFVLLSENDSINHLLYAFVDVYIAVSFAVVVWLLTLALSGTRLLLNRIVSCFSRTRCTANDECHLEPPTVAPDAKGTTEKYFNHLQSAWAL